MNQKLSVKVEAQSVSLCLDFANTVVWHASQSPVEKLNTYGDLLGWAAEAGVVSRPQAEQLAQFAGQYPVQAEAARQQAIEIREAIYHIFSATAGSGEVDAADLDLLNETLAAAMAKARFSLGDEGYGWHWLEDEPALDGMLGAVLHSAASLLTTPELLRRVGECADPQGCGYLFLDLSKNRSRRWCDINDCGNRAKQRRHYQRARQKQA